MPFPVYRYALRSDRSREQLNDHAAALPRFEVAGTICVYSESSKSTVPSSIIISVADEERSFFVSCS